MKKALLFGINDYPGSANDLQGCLNDVSKVGLRLTDFGYDVRIFRDDEVKVGRFKDEIQDLLTTSNIGDQLVVWYSGHGTQVPDRNGDEPDGYDEAIYLYDGPFIDDDMQAVIKQKPAGVFLFMGMDCCFSGTNTRNLRRKDRFKPWVTDVEKIDHAGNLRLRKKKSFIRNFNMDYVVLTGCAEDQTSADAYIEGKYQGAMTYFAMKTLTGGITYADWYKKLRKYLPSNSFDQIPQLEGDPALIKTGVFGTELLKKGCLLKFL